MAHPRADAFTNRTPALGRHVDDRALAHGLFHPILPVSDAESQIKRQKALPSTALTVNHYSRLNLEHVLDLPLRLRQLEKFRNGIHPNCFARGLLARRFTGWRHRAPPRRLMRAERSSLLSNSQSG